jgi:hypothetical protein
MRGLSGAEFVVTDGRGQVVLATAELGRSTTLPAPAPAAAELRLGETVELGGARYLHASVQTQARGATAETHLLHVLFPQDVWRQSLRSAIAPPLTVGLVALALGVPLGALLSQRLCRRIETLRQHLGRLTRGDFAAMPLPVVDDELRDLAASANALAGQLEGLERAIRSHEQREALGQLGGGLAHELRNGIAGARLAVKIHERHCATGDAESLEVALDQLDLVQQQLQRYLLSQGPQTHGPGRCELAPVLDEVARLLAPAFGHRRVELTMPGAAGDGLSLPLGHDQARSLLSNLLLNALEAAGTGGWVRVEVEPGPGDEVALRVLDSGPGLPAEVAPRAFEPFVTSKREGAGLGLALCRQIAEACGGSLRYLRRDSATCFEFRAPRIEACGPTTRTAATSERALA